MHKLSFLFFLAAGFFCSSPLHSAVVPPAKDSVQQVLNRLARQAPDVVGYIPETGRRYIIVPRSSSLPPGWEQRIQDAFFYDIARPCRIYGQLYLADWQALASKAARESFWGCSYLSNRTFNYFGIRHTGKPWLCEQLGFCGQVVRNDPDPAPFAVFPAFEASLWAFLHTIYSGHFLSRLPDGGIQVADAIQFERDHGLHYWEHNAYGLQFSPQLPGFVYSAIDLIKSWSGHEINNLCINCDPVTDWQWVQKVMLAAYRSAG
jgi:hypothetical protein